MNYNSSEFLTLDYTQAIKVKATKDMKLLRQHDSNEEISSAQDPYMFMYNHMFSSGGGLDIPEEDVEKLELNQNSNPIIEK